MEKLVALTSMPSLPRTAPRLIIVKVTNTLPANVNFVRADGCSGSGRTVTCTLGNLASCQVVRRSITVRPTAPVRLRNAATVTANEPDPKPGNNKQTTETRVNL